MKKVIPILIILLMVVAFTVYTGAEKEQKKGNKTVVEIKNVTLAVNQPPISPRALEITKQESDLCENVAQSYQKIAKLESELEPEMYALALQVSKEFKQSGLLKKQQEKIVQNVNLPLIEFRKMTIPPQGIDVSHLLPVIGRPIPFKGATRTEYYQYRQLKNYAGVASMIESGSLTNQSIYAGKSIISDLALHDKNIRVSDVRQLVDAGLQPVFSDLVEMSEASVSIEVVDFMVGYVSDINQPWYDHFKSNTLTMLAAKKLNFELFNYWFSRGVPFFAKEFDYTAVDMLPEPTTEQEMEKAVQIFVVLADNDVEAYKTNTLDKLKKWLPSSIQKKFQEYLTSETKAELTDFELDASPSLLNLVKIYNERTAAKKKEELLCNKKNTQDQKNQSNDVIEELATLTERTAPTSSLLDKQVKKHLLSLMIAKDNGDWDSYLANADDMMQQMGSPEMYNLALFQAIQNNAPISVIRELLNRGAVMPPNAIIVLTISSNLELTKQLIPLELNLYFKDQQNKNALYYAVAFDASIKMFEFLLDNDVPLTKGVDLLGPLLKKQNSNTVYYSERLVAIGHKIEPSHIAVYEQFEENNPPFFDSLRHIFGNE